MAVLENAIAKVRQAGSKKIAGENSLELGEAIAFVSAIAIYKYGAKIPVVGKWHKAIAWGIVLAGMWIW